MSKIDTHKGIIAWFARNSIAANLLMFCLIVGGLLSAVMIEREIFPDITTSLISVRVAYPGAAPQEVEEGITAKIEAAIEDIEGIKKITSEAREGSGNLTIEVESGYEVPEVLDEIKIRMDGIPNFPEQIESPLIYQIKPRHNVLWVQIYGDIDEATMKEMAKDIRDEIVALPAVTSADVIGERDYEIAIEVSEVRLREYNLSFNQIVNAVRNSSLDIPGGSIKTISGDILLRSKGQAYRGEEFEQIVLLTRDDGTRLLLGDVAQVRDGFEEREGYISFNSKPSIGIRVSSVGQQDDLLIAKQVKNYLQEKRPQLPSGVKIDYWGDNSYYLQGRLDMMLKNMLFGALLVFIILALFLRLNLAFWVILGIPVCFLGALLLMPTATFDLSINMITLFGFILVLGIVVDDAIIIGESAYTEIEKNGHSAESVIAGAKRVAMPATFGVLTTIVAFVPMLLVSGDSAPIWSSIAWVVILCLAFSLIESKWILPAHLVHMKTVSADIKRHTALQRLQDRISLHLKNFVEQHYRPFLARCLQYRYATLASFFSLLLLTIGLIGSGAIRWVFFPDIPSDYLNVRIAMNEGTPAAVTNKTVATVEAALYEMNAEFQQQYDQPVVKHSFSYTDSATEAFIWVELLKGEEREINGREIANLWRDKVGPMPSVKNINFSGSTNNGGGDIAFQLVSDNLTMLTAAAKELREKLAAYNGVYDIQDSLSGGKQEIVIKTKPAADVFGVSLADIARQVRQAFYGAEAQRIQRDGEEVKIMVRYPLEERRSVGNLEDMRIRSADGREIPFSTVATLSIADGYGTITSIDGVRSVLVEASADKNVVEPSKITKEISEEYLPELLKRYPGVQYGLTGDSREEGEALGELGKGALLALFAIYALMAVPLRSYTQPLIIMSVIPFGIIGAIIGHGLLDLSISVLSLFGITALAGVVVNDSLIMVDFVNRAREQGVSLYEAALNSGAARFRAIILTSLTTFFGLLPIVLERSLQAQIVIPMAVSLAFGILFSTVITLVLIPALYLILDDIKLLMKKVGAFLLALYKPQTTD